MAVKELVKPVEQKEDLYGIQRASRIVLNFSGVIDFTDELLLELSARNRDLQIEKTKKGMLIVMSPMGGESSERELILSSRLFIWNKKNKLGKVFSPSGGFKLPNKAILSPDASFIPLDKWKAIPQALRKRFPPICPDFVAELRSESDSLKDCKEKMTEWMENGCRLAWLIDPLEEKAYIYRLCKDVEVVDSFDEKLSGEDVLPKFELDLSELKEENN